MAPRRHIHIFLPVLLRELLKVIFDNFYVKFKRYQPTADFTFCDDELNYPYLTSFEPLVTSEEAFNKMQFKEILPFEEYEIRIIRACFDNARENIGYKYSLDPRLSDAITHGLMASDNTQGDPESIRCHQHFLTSNFPVPDSLISELSLTLQNLNLTATVTHSDLLVRTRTLPLIDRDKNHRFVLRDHVLVLQTEAETTRRRADIIQRRQQARETIQIPAGTTASLRPVPGNQLEAASRLAEITTQITSLNSQMASITAQFQLQPPPPPAPPAPVIEDPDQRGGDNVEQDQV